MKRGLKNNFQILLMLLLTQTLNTQYVYTQLGGIKTYGINTPQDNQVIYLGEDFESTKQYSLWGWFKPNSQNPTIQNIITLQNLKGSQQYLQNAANNFPSCPYTKEQLLQNESSRNLKQVQENPNCNYELLDEGSAIDLLIVNFDILPNNNQLVFLIAKGFNPQINNSNMNLEVFNDIPKNQEWIFFGFSADYENGIANLYMQSSSQKLTNSKQINLEYPNFNLENPARLIIAGIQRNDYYESQSSFIGQIANIEISRFFTQNLSQQWAGFIPQNKREEKQIIVDLVYDINENENKNENDKPIIRNKGTLIRNFPQFGKFEILNKIDQDQYGLRYYENSHLSLSEDIPLFSNSENIKSTTFYFKFKTSKYLPAEFILLTRGQKDKNGYIQISIVSNVQNQKFIRIKVTGPNETKIFDQQPLQKKDNIKQILISISQGLDNSLLVLYADSNGNKQQKTLYNVSFDTGFQQITMFNPSSDIEQFQSEEYIDMLRFMILSSSSPVVNYYNKELPSFKKLINQNNILQEQQCQIKTDVYQDQLCIDCKNSIVNLDYQCVPFCTEVQYNFKNDICLPCNEGNQECLKVTRTSLKIKPNYEKLPNDQEKQILKSFEIEPTKSILNGPIPYDKFQFSLVDKPDVQIQKTIDPSQNNKVQLQFQDIGVLDENQKIKVVPQFIDQQQYIDVDRNIIKQTGYDEQSYIYPIFKNNQQLLDVNANPNIFVQNNQQNNKKQKRNCYTCDAPHKRLKKMRVLAYILLLSYASVAFILLLMSIIAFKKFWNLGGLWKFLLHHWMKLNLIAFFVLLAINMPCCVRSFLHQIYRFTVSWDHELRHWINNTNDGSHDYNKAFIKRTVPCQFYNEHVRPFILHNLLITFIVQLAIALVYIILKIWDYLQTSGRSFLFNLLVFWEFTALIIGYLLFHMRDFVFSALNIREVIFSHSYFVFCFFISIFYILVFVLFWLYSLYRILLTKNQYWSDPININKFYYFRAGYKDNNLARTYDHWVTLAHFIVGLSIGFLIYEPLAQMIIITAALILLFAATLLLNPWKNIILLICDVISQIAILLTVIIFLIYSILDKGSCKYCGNREGGLCWLIVLFIFILFMLALIGLLVAALQDCLKKDVVEELVERRDIYHQDQEFIMNHASQKHIYPIAQDMLDADSRYENKMSTINRNTDSINVNQTNTNNVLIERYTDTTVKQVQGVQPDEVDEDSMQNELFGLMNDQSLKYRQSQIELANHSKILNEQKNEFYSTLDQESRILKNQTYKGDSKFGQF